MKIHPLELGSTKVPYGQFYGGLGAWKGSGAITEFLGDKDHFIRVPIRAYLVEHKAGPVLVDTGISPEQAEHRRYYGGSIFEYLLDVDEYEILPGHTIEEQLARFGFTPDDIRTVVITHLHEDHIGNLGRFPEARVLLGRREWETREIRALGAIPLVYDRSLEPIHDWKPVDFTGRPVPGFDGTFDLFGDGTVLLLPTPGHSPGSTSVLVDAGDHRLLLPGDALYTLRHLAVDDVRAIQLGDEDAYVQSIRRMQHLRRLAPQVIVLPAHDHTDYGTRVTEALAEHGSLDAGTRTWVREHERELFDDAYRLNPARSPRFLPERDGIGLVA